MPSEIRSIGLTIRRLAKGTIDLVRWRAPVQLLKYATRTVWFKNVNTGYPVAFKTALLHMHPYFMISSIERISETKKKASPRPGSSSRGTDGVGHDASRPSQQRVQRQRKQLGGFL